MERQPTPNSGRAVSVRSRSDYVEQRARSGSERMAAIRSGFHAASGGDAKRITCLLLRI